MTRALRFALPFALIFRLAITALGLGPVAVSPADGEGGQPTDLTLVWEPGVHTNLIANGASTFQFRFNSEVGRTYRVERLADLVAGVWLAEPGTFDGDGSDLAVDLPMTDPEAALYRVVVE